MLSLNSKNIFTDSEKGELGIVAKKVRGRWQYRDVDSSNHLYASGMEPAAFAKKFWSREDFSE